MREVLVDFARRRKAAKRGGDLERLSLGKAGGLGREEDAEILGVTARTVERNWLEAWLFCCASSRETGTHDDTR